MQTAVRERPILFSGPMIRAILDGRKTQTRRIMKPQPPEGVDVTMCSDNRDPDGNAMRYHAMTVGQAYDTQFWSSPFGLPGDRLWVRETFRYWERRESDEVLRPGESRDYTKRRGFRKLCKRLQHEGEDYLVYAADGVRRSLAEWTFPHPVYEHCVGRFDKAIPSIHMPRWASRITLEVTGVRVEQLQEISDADATSEGIDVAIRNQIIPSPLGGIRLRSGPRNVFMLVWDSLNAKRGYPWESNPWCWVVEFERIEPAEASKSSQRLSQESTL